MKYILVSLLTKYPPGDLTAWSAAAGHTLLDHKEDAGVLTFYIKKA